MKLNYYLDPDDPIRKELEQMGIEYDPSSDYIISRKSTAVHYLPARKEESIFYLDVKNIIFIESMGHDILIHMQDGVYNSTDRLKQLEKLLDPNDFLRVSNSAIVNLRQVQRIESSLLQKFILHMKDGSRVDVTRSYYYIFKDRIGI